MRKVKALFLNFILLCGVSVILQTVALSFQAYLARNLGSEGLGLLQLTLSVYFLAATFASSGMRFTATRLVAEELGARRPNGAIQAVRLCLACAAAFSIAATILVNLGSNWIGTVWLNDARVVLPLRVFSFSLPLISLSGVFSGYFIGVRKAADIAAAQLIEQVLEVTTSVALLRICLPMGLAYSCAAAALGCVLGELGSCFIQFVLYRKAIKNQSQKNSAPTPHLFRRLLHIAAPTALSSYVTSSIRTIEQLLIPYGLKKGGASGSGALATFGIIRGMAMPLILFPAFLLSTALDLVLPELTESQAAGHLRHLSYIIRRVYRIGILFSVCMMWIFLRFSHELGMLIYQSTDAAYFIRRLAILAPFFYLDMITDMMVRGLGRHMSTMKYNLITSLVSVVLLYLLLPKFAITGYLITVYCSKILNFTFSLHKLVHISNLKIRLFDIFKAVLCMIASAQLANLMSRLLPVFPEPFSFLAQIALTILFYILNLRIFACVSREDIAWCRSLLK